MLKMKKYNLILYTGITLWIIGFLLNSIFTPGKWNIEGQLFLTISASHRWLWAFLLFSVAIPIFAEGAFRYWGTGEKKTTWMSFTCMLFAVIVICVKAENTAAAVAASIIAVMLLMIILYMLLSKRQETNVKHASLIFGSSFIWITYYSSFIEDINIASIFCITKLTGLALICCYLVKKHGILFSVFAHVCNNAIVAIPILFIGMQQGQFEVEEGGLNVSLQRVYNENRVDSCSTNQILIQGDIEDITSAIVRQTENTNVLYVSCTEKEFLNYRLLAESNHCIQPGKIFSILEKNKMIALDTTYEPLWILELSDNYGFDIQEGNGCGRTTLKNFVKWIRLNYKIPLILNPSINSELPFDMSGYNIQYTLNDVIRKSNSNDGIEIFQSPFEKACVVRINSIK